MHSKTILQAKEDLRQKKYSAVELTEAVYQRIDSVESKIQAFVHWDFFLRVFRDDPAL